MRLLISIKGHFGQNIIVVSLFLIVSIYIAYSAIYIYVNLGGWLQSPKNLYPGEPMHSTSARPPCLWLSWWLNVILQWLWLKDVGLFLDNNLLKVNKLVIRTWLFVLDWSWLGVNWWSKDDDWSVTDVQLISWCWLWTAALKLSYYALRA